MTYRFILLSDENDFFKREIEINSDDTFLSLNNIILDSAGYDHTEMTSFFLCDEEWNKGQEVTLMEMETSSEEDNYVMDSTRLEDLIEDEHQHLLFVFDMLSERAFFMDLVEIIPGETLDKPRVTLSEGSAPEQLSSLEFAETRVASSSSINDMFDEEGIDFDDLDPDGFSGLDDGSANIDDIL